jgi:hypothetical protein
MNNITLGYSFIDGSESGLSNENKVISTSKILNRLKVSKNQEKNNGLQNNSTSPPNITAFSEDDEENNGVVVPVNPLIQSTEGFTNYDMNDGHYTNRANPASQSPELLYDFNRHVNNHTITQNYSLDKTSQEKINYIIHMLEQNRQLRTENITEEMIMYFFVGCFVLYISENFVKMGKYTR